MDPSFQRIVRILIFFLGVYEWLSIGNCLIQADIHDKRDDFLLLNADLIVKHKPLQYMLYIFLFYLGLNRITWAIQAQFYQQQNNFYPWLNAVLTHAIELVFFYSLAFLPHFNVRGLNFHDLMSEVIHLKVGNKHSRIVLLIVPILLFLIVLHGPTNAKVKLNPTLQKKAN